MRSLSSLAAPAAIFLVGACSIFGTNDPAPEGAPAPPPQDPATNATPPVTGTPLVGVFVSASRGRDDASGNSGPEALKTLSAAMKRAKERGQRVLACAETYSESLVLIDGVSMFGGFDCSAPDAWVAGKGRTRIDAPTSPALLATNILLETRVDGFELNAPSFDKDEPSDAPKTSIGAEIRGSARLTIANSILRAGAAGRGKDGVAGAANVEKSSDLARTGGAASGPGGSNVCPTIAGCLLKSVWSGSAGGTSSCAVGAAGGPGGRGGNGQFLGDLATCASVDVRGQAYTATPTTAQGSIGYCQDLKSGGVPKILYGSGSTGAVGTDGADGANGTWTLSATGGFVPGTGSAGKDAAPGQGGGGGGGAAFNSNCNAICPTSPVPTYRWSSAGGGGGAGGCAGLAGTPGTGGGASIGAMVTDSQLTLIGTKVESARGGAGGAGTLGSAGLPGGAGGNYADQAGAGGSGGRGGAAGLSGHGAPGPSIALVYAGDRPTLETSELVPGLGGDGQPALAKTGHTLPAVAGEALAEKKL